MKRTGSPIDYSYINARIHGLISKLLTEEQFAGMDRSGSVTEVLHLLREGPYSSLAEIYNATGDIKMVERELFVQHRRVFANLTRHSPDPLKPMVAAFAAELDFHILKTSLRLWFDQSIRKRSISDFIAYIPDDITWNGITPQAIINARNRDTLKTLLTQAGLTAEIPHLLEEIDAAVSTGRLFYAELAVDRGSCIQLLRGTETLGHRDRSILTAIIGEDFDARNLTRVLRSPELFSRIPADWTGTEITDYVQKVIIPGGSHFSSEKFTEAVLKSRSRRGSRRSSETGETSIDAVPDIITMINNSGYISLDAETVSAAPGKGPGKRGSTGDGGTGSGDGGGSKGGVGGTGGKRKNYLEVLLQINRHLQNHLLQSARRAKRGDPFTIGTLAAYLILKEREITRIQSLINAKYYGLKLMDIEAGSSTGIREKSFTEGHDGTEGRAR
jgi:vacuolar-type H+-ATPase subunit C/Vma6